MSAIVEHYEEVTATFPDTEQLTVLTVAGATRDQVAAQLEVDLTEAVDEGWGDNEDTTAWALLEIPGGVLAVETTGYGDPSNADLTALSALSDTGAAAVTRSNIMAHSRFGCAGAGELLFDDDEFVFIEDPDRCPAELRPLFDLVHDDLASDDDPAEGRPDPFSVGLAMAQIVTGVEVTPAHVQAVFESGFFAAPAMRYLEDLGGDWDGDADGDGDGDGDGDTEAGGDNYDDYDKGEFAVSQPDRGGGSRRAPEPFTSHAGMYAIAEDQDSIGEPPTDWPADTLCVTVGNTVWIRSLTDDRSVAVRPLVWAGDSEPAASLARHRATTDHEGSAALTSRGPLSIVEPGWSSHFASLTVTSGGYAAQLRVFARPAGDGSPEFHFLYVWPDPLLRDWRPDVYEEVPLHAPAAHPGVGTQLHHMLAARTGVYSIGEREEISSDVPTPWPADTLCVKVGPGSAWVRKLSADPEMPVWPVLVSWNAEPTEVFDQLAEGGYHHETSVVLTALHGPLHIFDEGTGDPLGVSWDEDDGDLHLNDGPGIFNVRVFAKPPGDDDDFEAHVIVVWPAIDAGE